MNTTEQTVKRSPWEQLTLDNVVCKRRYLEPIGWQDWDGELNEAQKTSLLALFGSGCRAPRVRALRACFDDNCRRVKSYGILKRVHLTDEGASYCAGQDYPSEIRTVREILTASY